jgi:small-conductance mechanosensitive channel
MHILQAVANTHPTVVKNDQTMRITVLCQGFGEESLKFELRCFVANIEARIGVTSELNLAIDKAFRQDGIELPALCLGSRRVAAASDNV